MRGIYNGEIKDRPHVIQIFFLIVLPVIMCWLPFLGASNWWKHGKILNGWLCFASGLLLLWFLVILFGKEFIFLTINKSKIIIRRPFLRISPFKRDKTRIEIPVEEVAEINTYTTSGRYGGGRWWRIISKDRKEILKFVFNPEFIFSTVEPEDYFKENNINIRVNHSAPQNK